MTESRSVPYGVRLSELAAERGEETALIVAGDDGTDTVYTWRALDGRANQIARCLLGHGIAQGNIVANALPNSLLHVATTFAAWKVGASVLPLRSDLPPWERERLLDVADPKLVVGDWDVPRALPSSELWASVDLSGEPLDGAPVPPHSRMIATSGSTGTPKLIVGPDPALYVERPEPMHNIAAASSVVLCASPLYHTNGSASCYAPLLAGSTVVLLEHFDAARAVDLIERYHVTGTILVPTMLQRIARLDGVRSRDFSSLRNVNYGGASLPEWVARTWLELVGPEHFIFSYGGSEGIGLTMCTGVEWLLHPGTSGVPRDCELAILGPDGEHLPPGSIGQVYMRSPGGATFRYVGIPTPEPIAGGYRTFGDMGWVDEDGFLYIADRRQDMIVTGGVNVFPAEVEAALSEHPDVEDVVVVGIPDPEWGHRVHAIVQGGADESALRAFAKERLSGPKVPKTFELVAVLPRTSAGKINRSKLVEERTAAQAQ